MNNQNKSTQAISSTKGINNANPHALLRLIIQSHKRTITIIVILLGLSFFAKFIIPQRIIDHMYVYSGKKLNVLDSRNAF